MEHDTAGDPITGLKWTRKTTEKIAEVLQQIDIPVSANTVARLLYQMNFSLRVNRKQIATNSSPYRDQQFQHIGSLRTRFQRQGLPVISVDSKKREMIGNFKNGGAKWDRSPVLVNDHDFRSDASGVGISYGIYEPPRNHGTVCVWRFSRHPGLRRPFHRHLVETAGGTLLWPHPQTSGSGRLRRQQQLHFLALEDRTPGSSMQSLRDRRHHLSLPDRRLQVESHRAPVVFRNLQKLGG